MTSVLPLKESFRALIVELAHALEPYFPDITADWRERLAKELTLDGRAIAALERITLATASNYFCHNDFNGFNENVGYFGTRLAKLQVDTRSVRRALDIFEELCEPYLASLFGERQAQAAAGLEMVSSSAFVAVSAAYFDAKSRESTALLRVLDAELGEQELPKMLQRVLEITCDTFNAVVGAVLLRDLESDLLRVEATVGLEENLRGEFSVELGQGFSGGIARSGEPEMVMDASRDPRIVSPMLRSKAKSIWGVPLRHEQKTIGVLLIGFAKPYGWMPTERELLRAIADRSALAIHRARITAALREREARIAELSAHLLKVQEEERKRISRELHDETGQALMVIRLYLGMLDSTLTSRASKSKVKETLEVVDRTIEGIRRIIGKLSPLVLQELGLFAAIRKEAKDLEKNRGVKTRVAISDEVGRLSSVTETALYRIVQESLHNVAKHAHANNVNISMERENGTVRLIVEDDGVGIFPKSNYRGNSFGLAGIKERVGMLGGEVRVISLKGEGTRIEVAVPVTSPVDRLGVEVQAEASAVYAPAGGEGNGNAENKMSTH